MEFRYGLISMVCLMVVLLPSIEGSQDSTYSRATYYSTPDHLGTPSGACGFGETGRTINDAYVTGVSKLYRNGTGCGTCYQVRCKVPKLCTADGVNVVVTDYGQGDRTDFILSTGAYGKLARPKMASKLFAYGVVDVEYRRVPCQYDSYNVMFKVHENSRFPDYLALVILYVDGQNDVLAVQLWQENRKQWVGMRKAYGAVWDMPNPPMGPITLRFQVKGSAGFKWVRAANAIPRKWKAGVAYDSHIQLN